MATDAKHPVDLPRYGYAVVNLSGDIDLGSGSLVTARLGAAAERNGDVVADLSDVSFIDCAGLAALIRARDLLPGRLWLRAPAPAVAWLLHATGERATFAILPGPLHHVPGLRSDIAPSVAVRLASDGSLVERLELQVAELQEAARYGAVIEQAKGLLMATHRYTASAAWRQLTEAASSNGVRVQDLSAALVAAAAGPSHLAPGADVLAAAEAVMVARTPLEDSTNSPPKSPRRRRGTIALRSIAPAQMSLMVTRKANG